MNAWGGHKNGQIPKSALVSIGNGQLAQAAAADAWFKLRDACKAATGVTLYVNEGYRPLGVRADANIPQLNSSGVPARSTSTGGSNQWFQRGRATRKETPSAAIPGTSVHGWALALDIGNYAAAWDWLKKNARKYGYAVDVIAGERWHIEYIGKLTLAGIITAIKAALTPKEQDMQPQNFVDESTLVKGKAVNGTKCITLWPTGAITHTPRVIPTPKGTVEKAVQLSRLYGAHKKLSHDLYEQIIADHGRPAPSQD